MKKIWFFILVILIGGLAGILSSGFLMPFLSRTPLFENISWLKEANNGGTTIINKTEQVIIEEGQVLENAIEKISPSVVGIVSQSKLVAGKTKKASQAIYGTGFMATGDGLILTVSSAAPEGSYDYFISKDNQSVPAQIVKRDTVQGLVLIKINETNLPVVSFGEADSLRLGQRILLIGADALANPMQKLVNFGIIRSLTNGIFSFSLEKESQNLSGAPLIDINGNVIGVAQIDSTGKIKVVSSETIKKFLGQ
jgi:S1-C subfamily serine protease